MAAIRVGDWVMVTPAAGRPTAKYGQVLAVEQDSEGRPVRYRIRYRVLTAESDENGFCEWVAMACVTSYDALKATCGPHDGVEREIARQTQQQEQEPEVTNG